MKTSNPMKKYIEEWQRSGKSIKLYCLEKGISKDKFDYWRIRKWQRKEKPAIDPCKNQSLGTQNFLPVKIHEDKKFLLEIKIESSGNILLRIGESNDIS